jgi:hypothetical protein
MTFSSLIESEPGHDQDIRFFARLFNVSEFLPLSTCTIDSVKAERVIFRFTARQ